MLSHPPLNALRAFEVAARHMSFTQAAEELNVTPAAVGHQVKALEDYLGIQLFRRLNRALRLTDAGQACLPELRDGFTKIAAAVERVRSHCCQGTLNISVETSFAAKWLVRRLELFRSTHPEIEVRLDASTRLVDLQREDVDLAIRYGAGRYPGLHSDRLFADEVYPVSSPKLLEGPHPLHTLEDLRWHTLLHQDGDSTDPTWPDWETWLRSAGCCDHIDHQRGPRFSQVSMTVEAAIAGHGVALASSALTRDDLEAGRLVRPFGPNVASPLNFAYYMVTRQDVTEQAKIAAFREWILAQAGEDEA